MGAGLYPQQLSSAFKVDFVTTQNSFERVGRRIGRVSSKNRPDRRIFRAQPAQREAGRGVSTGGPHLVKGGNAVKEPDDVVRVVFFVVLVMRIVGRRIEFDLRGRVSGIDYRFLETDFLRIGTLSPVVTIIAQRNDRFGR